MKRIRCDSDLEDWYKSPAHDSLQTFLQNLFTNIKGLKLSEIPAEATEIDAAIWKLLDRIEGAVGEVPIIENGHGTMGRYGNKAFRSLMERIEEIASKELEDDFLAKLLANSFGDATRIDYGTGHELFFLIFISCYLNKSKSIKEVTSADYARLGGWLIGTRYLDLVRRIQRKYSLEPAGSHGVWGLDDHQFIPFLLGSAQLIGQDEEWFEGLSLSPASIITPRTFSNQKLRQEYLYPAALDHIHRLKTRTNPSLQFHHHSPLLYDISGVKSWEKIFGGLGRMYGKEVLGKVPVVQHLLFDDNLFRYK